ncbi:hypothetical protein A2643_04115 [Candidatus Nomurabacteria bacterium RIFCSPHIGHO2_01_FULL_39_220]|nr:MAG: hypothetical protein A3C75_02930 [Candidatus Giovannonibacteria bacterium RIFCSPHIGHO2_02_FULL_44_31]OGF76368.1 MAG: hypothetical protein A3E62_03185 [Candidatus Giovannonibacteria bacterium RIFCSPHIGHO2_12_FULL_44_29]OGI69595.1 MAG: hypothetical protein A2643_04115 [Candidatus Nomurabacteria bacterium RIFCSPHIGHO2_01_FULL_39_220]OGI91001.1 MAG: hypothetical protein A3A06_02715 [Candidatus Nomurabacteria bacterium RIFCSPLOWO2_01_FULL_41_220]
MYKYSVTFSFDMSVRRVGFVSSGLTSIVELDYQLISPEATEKLRKHLCDKHPDVYGIKILSFKRLESLDPAGQDKDPPFPWD